MTTSTKPATDARTAAADRPLLRVRDLKTHFPVRSGILQRITGWVKAVDGVSFDLARGETLGLVGESGCGKTTVGRTILKLIPHTSGTVEFEGRNVFAAHGGPEGPAARHADHLPGPGRLAQPTHARRRDRRRAARGPRAGQVTR
ncbi:MAG TPA: ABC transporter ATP-binding protein [Phycisphaerales bacterium]|nr:ABC transporter ATP-binding protein [Phycisphaerales bacterium]